MGREYTALPHEYLEEMDCLSDAEYGRLIRGLQQYSITGEEPKLSGQEKVYWKRVRNRENRYQEGFEEQEKVKAERAKNAANARWRNKPGANACTSNANDANACTSTTSNAKNANTNTKANTNTDANISPPIGGEEKPAGKPPTRPRFTPPSVDEVRAYCQECNYTAVDPERFVDFYQSKGWKVGKDPMEDWKAAVRNWSRDRGSYKGSGGSYPQNKKPIWGGAGELGEAELEAIQRALREE